MDDPAPIAGSAQPAPARVDPLTIGPAIRLPGARMALAAAGAGAVVALAGWVVSAIVPAASARAAAVGAAGAVGAFLVGIALLRPWREMPIGRWLMAWMAHLGVCFLATVAAGALLLYSSPPDERLTLGLALAVGHFGALMAEAAVVASHLKACRGFSAASPG